MLVAFCGFVASPLLWAVEVGAKTNVDYSGQLIKTVFSLVLVLIAIVVTTLVIKRFQLPMLQNRKSPLQIVAALPLSAKEKILLIQAGEQQLLIGVTAQQIQTLHVFTQPIDLPENNSAAPDFASKLAQFIQREPKP